MVVVVVVVVVVVAAADCSGGGDGHLYVAIVLVVVVEFYLVRTWYQEKSFCADAHRLTMKAISQGYCTVIGLTECIRFNKLKQPPPDPPLSFFETRQEGILKPSKYTLQTPP